MSWRSSIVVALVAAAMLGCGPELTRYYKSATFEPELPDKPLVAIVAFSRPVGSAGGRTTLLDLSDEGQSAFVEAMAAKITAKDGPRGLAQALALPIAPASKPSAWESRLRFTRRIVFAVTTTGHRPADRLCSTDLLVLNPTGRATFVGWNRYETQYATVDLGKLTAKQQRAFSLQVAAAPPALPTGVSATAGYEHSRALTEQVELRRRYIALSGVLTPVRASLLSQSAVGIDLAGNTFADLQIAVPPFPAIVTTTSMRGLFDGSGARTPAAQVAITEKGIQFPADARRPITAVIRLDHTVRHVLKGDRTYIESDDTVRFYSDSTHHGGASPSPVVLVPAEQMRMTGWQIIKNPTAPIYLNLAEGTTPKGLVFETHAEAKAFLRWLKTGTDVTIGGHKLLLGTPALQASDIPDLEILMKQFNW